MRNWHMENTSPKQRITIRQRGGGVNSPSESKMLTVSAPLPDGFGMTVGSEFGTPFDTGGVNDTLSKLFALGRISQKAGIRMKKMYMTPEPVEISFDMEFFAYYNAKTEVLFPVVTLMSMAVGRKLDYPSLVRQVETFYNKIAGGVASLTGVDLTTEGNASGEEQGEVEQGISRLIDMINVIQGPPTSEIRFGDAMVLPECFITSVATSFSNVLDQDGIPMGCKCSVTATLESAPVAEDIYTYFDFRDNS